MTTFNIQKSDLRYIFDITRIALAKAGSRLAYQYIKFEAKDGELSAYALDGYRLHSVTVPIDSVQGDSSFAFLLKPFNVPACESSYISCELYEDRIMFDFGRRKFIEPLGAELDSFPDVQQAIPGKPPCFKIGFNPCYLADALKGFKNPRTPVVIELFAPHETVIIRNSKAPGDFRLVLPVRLRE